MFSSDQNITEIRGLLHDLKRYFALHVKYARLDFAGKMTVLLSALVLGVVLFTLASIIILLASVAAAYALQPYVGGVAQAFGIVALGYAVVALIVYWCRSTLITAPLANFLGRLFLEDDNEKEEL